MKPAGNRSSRVASLAILERQASFQSKNYTYQNSKKEIQGGGAKRKGKNNYTFSNRKRKNICIY